MGLSRKRTPVSLGALTYAALSVVQASGGDIGARAGARARSSPNGPIRALTGAQGQNPPPPPPFGHPHPPSGAAVGHARPHAGLFVSIRERLADDVRSSATFPGTGYRGELPAHG